MRPWFHLVARQKSPELFMLNLLLFALGLAWVTGRAGLSLAAGCVPGRHADLGDRVPLSGGAGHPAVPGRLLGLFFVTVGMQLDVREVAIRLPWVAALLVGLLLLEVAVDHRPGSGIAAGCRHGDAQRPGVVRGRRVRSGAVVAGNRPAAAEPASVAGGVGGDDPVDAGGAFHHREERAGRAPLEQRGLDVSRNGAAQHRGAYDGGRESRHHLRIWPQRTEPRAADGTGDALLSSRWTSIRSASQRRRLPARAWCSAMRRAARC